MADAECTTTMLESGAAPFTTPFVEAVDVSLPPGGYDDYTGWVGSFGNGVGHA